MNIILMFFFLVLASLQESAGPLVIGEEEQVLPLTDAGGIVNNVTEEFKKLHKKVDELEDNLNGKIEAFASHYLNALDEKVTYLEGFMSDQVEGLVKTTIKEVQRMMDKNFKETRKELLGIEETGKELLEIEEKSKSWCRDNGFDFFFDDSCYWISTLKKNYDDASQDCKSKGSALIIISNDEEFTVFQGKVTDDTWIGMKESGGTYIWDDGKEHKPALSKWWHDDEPNHSGYCIHFWLKKEVEKILLDDTECHRNKHYVCEAEYRI